MSFTKLYEGHRKPKGCVLLCNGSAVMPRVDLVDNFRFDWGSDSESKVVALAILADFFQDDGYALDHYEWFYDILLADHEGDYFQFNEYDLQGFADVVDARLMKAAGI